MYSSHNQVGKTRVNKVRESLKSRKTHVQYKKSNKTGLDKLFLLQESLFKEGNDLDDYVDYITDKINKNCYYYRDLNTDKIDMLKKRYSNLIEKENLKYNKLGDEKALNRKRRKVFREKKRNMVNNRKRELINELFKHMKSSNSIGVLRSTELHSDDPEKWNNTKKTMFSGGRYIETHDKKWVDVYNVLVSPSQCHLFNVHSTQEMNRHVFEN